MRKIIQLLLFVGIIAQNACTPVYIQQAHGVTYSNVSLQQRVLVLVQNNCVPYLKIQAGNIIYSEGLPYGESVTAPLIRQPLTSGEFILMVKGYDQKGNLLGTDTRRYSISSYDGERNEVWEVNSLNLPNSRGGCLK